jgi:drug/metabolite transporter (DMT)-like permease
VWLAFGEIPAAATFLGGMFVLAAVLGHVLIDTRKEVVRI